MTRYFLGVDIGASKSHALIADEHGHAVGLGIGGPGNHEVVGYEGLTATLNAITDEALRTAGVSKTQVAAAGFGIAGYDWPCEDEPTRRAIETLGLAVPYQFVNDAVLGLIAGATRGWGVAVVSGTSCNCRGRDAQGREGRVTGAGPAFAEYAGAAELVGKAVQAIALAWSLRGPQTRLTDAFIALTGAADATDLMEGLTQERYHLTADAAQAVFRVAAEGDAVAQDIIRWAGRELGSLAVGVIRQLGIEALEFEVVLVGSMFKGSPLLTDEMAGVVHDVAPGANLVRLAAPPVVGGVLLAMEQIGLDTAGVRERLMASANRLFAARRASSHE
ncbi:MAG: BadF/BadG/BcrA/BcrD ATPase family protein [Anaerolineae bacterium]|jgi:N-acetylglucosamine kinase-like BadF-type ATPase|nr:BadF/BadG/BcrA/BcrD ATPase family protein [Anaerolineae bacterium]